MDSCLRYRAVTGVQLWDLGAHPAMRGRLPATLHASELVLNADGSLLAADDPVRLWDTVALRQIGPTFLDASATTLLFTPDRERSSSVSATDPTRPGSSLSAALNCSTPPAALRGGPSPSTNGRHSGSHFRLRPSVRRKGGQCRVTFCAGLASGPARCFDGCRTRAGGDAGAGSRGRLVVPRG